MSAAAKSTREAKSELANFSGLFEMAWVLVPAPALPLFLSTRVALALEMAWARAPSLLRHAGLILDTSIVFILCLSVVVLVLPGFRRLHFCTFDRDILVPLSSAEASAPCRGSSRARRSGKAVPFGVMSDSESLEGDVSGGAPGDAPAPFMPPGGGGGANSILEAGDAAPGAYRGEKGVLRADAPLAPARARGVRLNR